MIVSYLQQINQKGLTSVFYETIISVEKDTCKGGISVNALKLKARMVMKEKSIEEMCAAMGISRSAFFRKTTGVSEFTQSEICILRKELELDDHETAEIFFDEKVS